MRTVAVGVEDGEGAQRVVRVVEEDGEVVQRQERPAGTRPEQCLLAGTRSGSCARKKRRPLDPGSHLCSSPRMFWYSARAKARTAAASRSLSSAESLL